MTKAADTAATRVEKVAVTEAKRIIRAAIDTGARKGDLQAARDEAAAVMAAAFTLGELTRAAS